MYVFKHRALSQKSKVVLVFKASVNEKTIASKANFNILLFILIFLIGFANVIYPFILTGCNKEKNKRNDS